MCCYMIGGFVGPITLYDLIRLLVILRAKRQEARNVNGKTKIGTASKKLQIGTSRTKIISKSLGY